MTTESSWAQALDILVSWSLNVICRLISSSSQAWTFNTQQSWPRLHPYKQANNAKVQPRTKSISNPLMSYWAWSLRSNRYPSATLWREVCDIANPSQILISDAQSLVMDHPTPKGKPIAHFPHHVSITCSHHHPFTLNASWWGVVTL